MSSESLERKQGSLMHMGETLLEQKWGETSPKSWMLMRSKVLGGLTAEAKAATVWDETMAAAVSETARRMSLRRSSSLISSVDIFSTEAVQARASLRSNPAVVEELQLWWRTALNTVRRGADDGPVPEQDELNFMLAKEQYIDMCHLVYKVTLAPTT